MEKPISMTIEETKNLIIDVINRSKLHPSVIELMLKGLYLEASMLSNDVLQREKEMYFDGLKKETNNELKEPTIE